MERTRLNKLHKAILLLLENAQSSLNRTKIVKLLFLADLAAITDKSIGTGISGITYQRYLYGPYSDKIIEALGKIKDFEINETEAISSSGRKYYTYTLGQINRTNLSDIKFSENESLDRKMTEILQETGRKYGRYTTDEILREVYALPQFEKTNFGDLIRL